MKEDIQDKKEKQEVPGDENITQEETQEKEIDIMELLYKLWAQRKVILVWCMWGVIAGLIIAFSIPREYSTKVELAPEYRSRRASLSGGLSALAQLAGISTTSNTGYDAVYPQLYPDIVSSVPFLLSLVDVPVKDSEGKEYTVREYLLEETSGPWWSAIMGLPGKIIKMIKGPDAPINMEINDSTGGAPVNKTFLLSKTDDLLVKILKGRVGAEVDPNTYVITVNSTMQDPVVSAMLADTVISRLRDYVTDYRTDKARKDLEYAQQLTDEAQKEYYKTQKELADYIDKNQNLASRSARITRERLENEATLAFNLYNETALQLQNAKSRVQETTPVYTILSPATVPLKPSAPRRGLIIAGFTFLAFAGACAWVLFGSPFLEEYKNKITELKAANIEKTESKKDSKEKDKKE